jgi:hypothetical protein
MKEMDIARHDEAGPQLRVSSLRQTGDR